MADATERHDGHDPALVASLFDGDLAGQDLATAQLWVATCPSCASLHADLLALSQATRAQPTPARPRDFRLTPEDAARLRAEPADDDARLTGVMTDRHGTPAHATHDTTLVASLADHSLPATERAAGMDLVATCVDCAALHADLVALVAATRAMPTPPRRIDYTLTRGHAARLRPNPLAPARRGRRIRARRRDPTAGDGSHRARAGRCPRRVRADHPPAGGRDRWQRVFEPGRRGVRSRSSTPPRHRVRWITAATGAGGRRRSRLRGRRRRRRRRPAPERAVASAPAFGAVVPARASGIRRADRRRDRQGRGGRTGRDAHGRWHDLGRAVARGYLRGERAAGRLGRLPPRRTGPLPAPLGRSPARRQLTRRRLPGGPRGYT